MNGNFNKQFDTSCAMCISWWEIRCLWDFVWSDSFWLYHMHALHMQIYNMYLSILNYRMQLLI